MASILKVNEIQHTGGTSAMTLSSAGVVTEPTKPSWKIHISTQTLTGSTWTLMNANSAVYNIGNHYNTTTKTFTAPVAGTYYIYGQWFGSVSSNRAIVAFYKNGTRFFESLTLGATSNGGISYQGCTTVQCVATDTLQWYGYHEQGSGVAVNTNPNLTHWGGFLIG
jgi:hypothetical protein